ncbi:MAG TPA: hypothetical protein VKV73_21825 [Chloroflexota bacterium]|nr:hypothetical protein [Chloroflexota bacterium]
MTVEGVVALIWIVALLIALVLTVAAVGMIVRIINAAREINRLLNETLPAAVGIVGNTAAIKELDAVVAAAGPLLECTGRIKSATEGVRAKVNRVGAMLSAGVHA